MCLAMCNDALFMDKNKHYKAKIEEIFREMNGETRSEVKRRGDSGKSSRVAMGVWHGVFKGVKDGFRPPALWAGCP
jgi:hypothetical protein